MRKLAFFLFVLLILSGCNIINNKRNSDQKTTTQPESISEFNKMYMNTIDKMINSTGFTYSLNYTIKFENTTTEGSMKVENDNISQNMKMTSSLKVNGVRQEVTDPVYISKVEDKFYMYSKFSYFYIANEINEEDYLIDNNDIITGNQIDSLNVTKVDEYLYTYDLPFNSLSEVNVLKDILSGFEMNSSEIDDVNIPIKYIFDQETQLLKSIKLDMSSFIEVIYKALFPDIDLSSAQMEIEYTNESYEATVTNPYINNAKYDNAPDIIDEKYIIPSVNLGEIKCQFDYVNDDDIYKLNVDSDGKYIIKFTDYKVSAQINIYDQDGIQLANAIGLYNDESQGRYKPAAYDLKKGTYYLSTYNIVSYTNQPTIIFEKVVDDDYSDYFENETNFEIEEIIDSTKITGKFNYKEDTDVFYLTRNPYEIIHIQIKTDGLLLTANGDDYFIEYQTYEEENGIYDFYIKDNDPIDFYLVLYSNGSLNKYDLNISYFTLANDEGNTIFDDNIKTISVGDSHEGAFLKGEKKDAYKFTVNEAGYYNITYRDNEILNGPNNISVSIFNSDKILLENVNGYASPYLEPGIYYIQMNYEYGSICTYYLDIFQAIDEPYEKRITLEDTTTINMSSNYVNDMDQYFLNVSEATLFTIKYQTDDIGRTKVVIKDINGAIVIDHSFQKYGSDEYNYIYLIPGEYLLEITGQSWGNYALVFNKTTAVSDDYPSGTSYEDQMGQLKIGQNLIKIDYRVDEDMYLFEALNDGVYTFKHDFYFMYSSKGYVSFKDESGKSYELDDLSTKLELKKGKYYFTFKFSEAAERNISIFYFDENMADEETREMTLSDNSVNFNGVINSKDDIDEFKITLEKDGLLIIEKDSFFNTLSYKLYDSENNEILFGTSLLTRDGFSYRTNNIYADLVAGTYTFKVYDTIDSKYLYNFTLKLDSSIKDDYANNFNTNNFGTLEFGNNTIKIDYNTDVDIFKLTVTEVDKETYFTFTNNFDYIGIYDLNFNRLVDRENIKGFAPSLEVGTYYVVLYSRYANDYIVNIRPI